MLNKYAEWIVIALTLITGYNTLVNANQDKEINDLKKANLSLSKENIRLKKKNSVWRVEAPRILRIGELNASNIKDLNEQQQLLNKYLGQVLNVSNLIPNKELGIEASDIIEELRQRVRWNEEVEAQHHDEEEYYKGG